MSKWIRAGKMFAGSLSIYVLVAACSGGSGRGLSAAVDGGIDAMHDAMATIGDAMTGGPRDAVSDVVNDVTHPVPDANAQDASSAGSCATCLGSPLRTISADSDPAQVVASTVADAASTINGKSYAARTLRMRGFKPFAS